jgi:WXG100 family type VII secretion target
MANELWGTPEDLAKAASAAAGSKSAIEGHVRQIENQVMALMGVWKGAAPVAFVNQHAAWRGDMDKLLAELQRIEEGTAASGNIQQNTDDDSVRAVQGPVAAGLSF